MKNIILKSSYVLFLCLAVSFTSCKKNEDEDTKPTKPKVEVPTEYDGSMAAIEIYLGTEIFNEFKGMGFNFYEGNEPPSIVGSYQLNSMRMQKSTVPNDPFSPSNADINFTSQNRSKLTINYEKVVRGGIIDVQQSQCKIAGNAEGYFTVLVDTKNKIAEYEVRRIYVISGKKTAAGLQDYQEGMIMIDNDGAIGYVEPNGKGRVVNESDGMASNVF